MVSTFSGSGFLISRFVPRPGSRSVPVGRWVFTRLIWLREREYGRGSLLVGEVRGGDGRLSCPEDLAQLKTSYAEVLAVQGVGRCRLRQSLNISH